MPTRCNIDYYDLAEDQRDSVDEVLWLAGMDEAGYTRDTEEPPLPVELRVLLFQALAMKVAINLAHGHTLVRCHECDDIGDAEDKREGFDRAWRCTTDSTCNTHFERDYDVA